jgi:hypothetical protein
VAEEYAENWEGVELMRREKTIKVTFTESDDMLYNNFIDILINSFLEEI